MSATERLKALGIELPRDVRAAADYLPARVAGGLLFLSGQTPRVDGELVVRGVVGDDVDLEAAARAARICALRLLAAARDVLGSLDAIQHVVELRVYVRSSAAFVQHSVVADAASALFVTLFAERGAHARTAVGVAQLPGGAAVEIAALLALA